MADQAVLGPATADAVADGAHAAFVIYREDDVERLLRASIPRWSLVDVIALPRMALLTQGYAALSGQVSPADIEADLLLDAERVARRALAELPDGLAARHVAYAGWHARPFLAALRSGAFDAALFAAWPPWPERLIVARAARRGGTAVLNFATPHADRKRRS